MTILSNATPPVAIDAGGQAGPSQTVDLQTFKFVAGWLLLITILVFATKTRLGYVIVYYALLLMILLILVSEYKVITPYFNAIQSPGQFDASLQSVK